MGVSKGIPVNIPEEVLRKALDASNADVVTVPLERWRILFAFEWIEQKRAQLEEARKLLKPKKRKS